MTDRARLEAILATLLEARFQGVRQIRFGDEEITYRSDAEMATVIADIERRIAAFRSPAVRTIRIQSSKGL